VDERGIGKCWRGHSIKFKGEPCARCAKIARRAGEETHARRAALKALRAASRAAFDARALAEAEESVRVAREACARTHEAVSEGEGR
jgi:hypothetical protein